MQLQKNTIVRTPFIKKEVIDETILKDNLSGKVLTIGPDHQNHRGGIGAVLSAYTLFYETFNFIPTYKYHTKNFTKTLFYIKQVGLLFKILAAKKEIRIVHIHGAQRGSFYRKFLMFIIAKKLFRKKVVYHMHSDCFDTFYGNSAGIQKKLINYFINNVDALICLAPFWKKFFTDNFRNKNIEIINNVIPKPINWHSYSTGEDSSVINFLFLGRIGHRKGIFDILNVISQKKELFAGKMKLRVGGDGETERLKEFISENKLEHIVEYVGWIQGQEKDTLLSKSDIYILPSYSEGLPISILEAMSYKLPVISTPVGGIPEIVTNDVNGKLVTPGNLAEIESAIRFFIDNPAKIKEFGKASYEKTGPYFPDFVSAQLQNVYNGLLTQN